jgi:hypothetical protein
VRKHCQTFLVDVLRKPLQDILSYIENCEIDPAKVDGEKLSENLARLEKATASIIDAAVSKKDDMPTMLRRICYSFSMLVSKKGAPHPLRASQSMLDQEKADLQGQATSEPEETRMKASNVSLNSDANELNNLSRAEMVIGTFIFLRFIIPGR